MKKGFTLVELIAVIIILALLSFLVVPSVDKTIKTNQKKLYENQLENIKKSAQTWGAANIGVLPQNINTSITITLKDLKETGLVEKNIKNPITKELFSDDLKIQITKKSNTKYIYEIIEP